MVFFGHGVEILVCLRSDDLIGVVCWFPVNGLNWAVYRWAVNSWMVQMLMLVLVLT